MREILFIIVFLSSYCVNSISQNTSLSADGQILKNAGLVSIKEIDTTIAVQLLYAGTDNFVGEKMYRTLCEAFLQPDAAGKLVKAQEILKEINPNYKLIVYDAARPQWAQQIMWNKVKDTPMRKYVSSPGRISMHSYGVAVDVSIIDQNNTVLNMGTAVDFLGTLAEPRHETTFLNSGELTSEHIKNRELLRSVMKKAGFRGIPNEWWHFEALTRADAQKKYLPLK